MSSIAPPSLTPEERRVYDATEAALAASDVGFDDRVLEVMLRELRTLVPVLSISIVLEEEGGLESRIFWNTRADSPFPAGTRVANTMTAIEPRIVENIGENDLEEAHRRIRGRVGSYVAVPATLTSGRVAWISVSHETPGAPGKAHLSLLVAITRLIAPALSLAYALSRYRLMSALLDEAADGVLAIDRGLAIREINGGALRLLARKREDVIGRTLAPLLGAEASEAIEDALGEILAEGGPKKLAIEALVRTDWVPFDLDIDVVTDDVPGVAAWVHIRDARRRIADEEATTARVEYFTFLRMLGEAMGTDLRVGPAAARAIEVCAARREVESICILRPEGGELTVLAERRMRVGMLDELRKITPDALVALAARYGREQDSTSRTRVFVDARLPEDGTTGPTRTLLLIELSHARRRLGTLLIAGRPGKPFGHRGRDLWDAVGETMSAALHAADDYERVAELEAGKRQLVDNLPVIVARWDITTSHVTFVNAAVSRVLGVTVADALGSGLDGYLASSEEIAETREVRAKAARGSPSLWTERKYRRVDGTIVTLREHVYPVVDASGATTAVEVIAYDVTSEVEARARMMYADRLASLGALAAGIAHEINNPVAFISLAASQMKRALLDGDRVPPPDSLVRARELTEEVGDAATRIAHIVGELKLFTRIPEGVVTTPVDVNRIVQTAVTLSGAELRRRASVVVEYGNVPSAPGTFSALGPVFVNLLLNAAQAIDAAVRRGGEEATKRHQVHVRTRAEGDTIFVTVEDTGTGIEPSLVPRIFEPFFTTRASGEGSGLGLSIAFDLVRKVGGDIRVKSEPGERTSFEVVLPTAAQVAGNEMSRSPSSAQFRADRGRARVLVIDDEIALAKALTRQLSGRYDVDMATSAADALAQMTSRLYDVVVCDLRMPDRSGPAIWEDARGRASGQAERFIFTTGGSYGASDDELHARAQLTGRPVLEKPFDGQSFEAAVEEVAKRPWSAP